MNAQLFPGLGVAPSILAEWFHWLFSALGGDNRPAWAVTMTEDLNDELNNNEYTQQRLVHGVNLLSLRLLQQQQKDFTQVCGHSLGFYAALVAAETIDEDSSFALLDQVMRLAKEITLPQTMLKTITSVRPLAAESMAQSIGAEIICINAPNQIVLHGMRANFQLLNTLLPGLSMCKVNDLPTSVPFHSRLLRPACQAIRDFIDASHIRFRAPKKTVWSHVDARPLHSCEEIVDTLAMQIAKPVQWHATIVQMQRQGVQRFAEAAPTRLLSRMLRWIDPDICLLPTIQTR